MQLAWLNTYLIAWMIYFAGVLGACAVTYRIFRCLPRLIKRFILAMEAALLLTPVASVNVAGWFVPAWLDAGYELALGDHQVASPVLSAFVVAFALAFVVWILDSLGYRLMQRKKDA